MSDTKRQTNFDKPWWKRKATYAVVAVLGIIATGLGFMTADQYEALMASPLLATIVGGLAYINTGPDSDSTTAAAEREKLRQELQENAAQLQASVTEQVHTALQGVLDYLPDRVQDKVREIYDAPYGKHDIQVAEPEPEWDPAGPGVYPGGR